MTKTNSSFANAERMANILNNIMNWMANEAEVNQQWSQDELYGTLHGAFGMTDEEIKAAGFACSPSDGGKTDTGTDKRSAMTMKTRDLCGDTCTVAVYGGAMRLTKVTAVTVSSTCTEKDIQMALAKNGIQAKITMYEDSSVNIETQCLVPWDIDEMLIEDINALIECKIERTLGLPVGESVSSAAWNAGHNSTEFDYLMSDVERRVIAGRQKFASALGESEEVGATCPVCGSNLCGLVMDAESPLFVCPTCDTALFRTPKDDMDSHTQPNILVCVDGGLVQGVACNIPGATCKIYDSDTEEYTEEDEAELNVLGNSPGYTWIY